MSWLIERLLYAHLLVDDDPVDADPLGQRAAQPAQRGARGRPVPSVERELDRGAPRPSDRARVERGAIDGNDEIQPQPDLAAKVWPMWDWVMGSKITMRHERLSKKMTEMKVYRHIPSV